MLLEHLKYLTLHNDVHPGDRFFWYSTTGWMMWNFLQASLLAGATAVLYDGSPAFPDLDAMWDLADRARITHFGTSAPFLTACMKADIQPGQHHDLSALRSIGSTGAPLPPEGFSYVYRQIKSEVWLTSMSGGTDVCTAWVGANPWRPVYEGEIQCRCLGCAMYAYSEAGQPLIGSVGEMVVTRPMPCMPVYFWNDPDYRRYLQSYFDVFPGVWRHGDWLLITERDSLVILGRSDATLNRQGVRIGTAEVYRAVDQVDEIRDSLIVNVVLPDGGDYMPLFVVMQPDRELDEHVRGKIVDILRRQCSPRHVPDEIIPVADIPYTISGKKMETPIKRILSGAGVGKIASPGAMRNPHALEFFKAFAQKIRGTGASGA
jgi:acetoacetyl-CoA synthetase